MCRFPHGLVGLSWVGLKWVGLVLFGLAAQAGLRHSWIDVKGISVLSLGIDSAKPLH